MTTIRVGVAFILLGIIGLVVGAFVASDEDLLHIGGVGFIVFGAVAICIATEANGRSSQSSR